MGVCIFIGTTTRENVVHILHNYFVPQVKVDVLHVKVNKDSESRAVVYIIAPEENYVGNYLAVFITSERVIEKLNIVWNVVVFVWVDPEVINDIPKQNTLNIPNSMNVSTNKMVKDNLVNDFIRGNHRVADKKNFVRHFLREGKNLIKNLNKIFVVNTVIKHFYLNVL